MCAEPMLRWMMLLPDPYDTARRLMKVFFQFDVKQTATEEDYTLAMHNNSNMEKESTVVHGGAEGSR